MNPMKDSDRFFLWSLNFISNGKQKLWVWGILLFLSILIKLHFNFSLVTVQQIIISYVYNWVPRNVDFYRPLVYGPIQIRNILFKSMYIDKYYGLSTLSGLSPFHNYLYISCTEHVLIILRNPFYRNFQYIIRTPPHLHPPPITVPRTG